MPMTHNKIKKIPLVSRGDIIIISALLAIAALIFALSLLSGGDNGAQAVVSVGGERAVSLPLAEDTEYTVTAEGHTNVIRIEGGEVFMLLANCPDGYCIEQGRISKTGEMIVCLPNRVTVTIEGAEEDFDAVAY